MNLYVFIYYLKKIENLNVYKIKIHYTLTVRENMRTFTIECDQQTIEQAVLDCIDVNKLLSDLHNRQSSEYETRRIGRVLTTCRRIEIFLRKIMKREFETRNASTMSSATSTIRTFTIECDQQTIEQAVLDCIEVKKLLSGLYGRHERETRCIGRALTECNNIEIFLREIMKREFETRNTSTMSSAASIMSSAASIMSSDHVSLPVAN